MGLERAAWIHLYGSLPNGAVSLPYSLQRLYHSDGKQHFARRVGIVIVIVSHCTVQSTIFSNSYNSATTAVPLSSSTIPLTRAITTDTLIRITITRNGNRIVAANRPIG